MSDFDVLRSDVGVLTGRVLRLEDTDRIAISGGKECDHRYREAMKRIEALEGGTIPRYTYFSIKAIEAAASAANAQIERDKPLPPPCASCRWFRSDNAIAAPSGTCFAHPMNVAKMMSDTCGEHAPR